MEQRLLGGTGASISPISLGTWSYGGPAHSNGRSVGWGNHRDESATQALSAAYEAGINHWDTADVYGDGRSEALIGSVLTKIDRKAIFLASKFGWDKVSSSHFYDPKVMRTRLERSLRLLNTDYLDLYYFHHCNFGPADCYLDDACDALNMFKDEGKIRFIGLSDWKSSSIMRVIDRCQPDVVQPYRSLLDDHYTSSGLKDWVEKNNRGVAFFSPLHHGLMLGKYDSPPTFPDGDFRKDVEGFSDPVLIDKMRECRGVVEERFGTGSIFRAVLGTLLEDSLTSCVLVGMRSAEQVASIAASFKPGLLSHEDALWTRELYSEPVAPSQIAYKGRVTP